MPYPILQLPYGLQRRFRSLTTQKELYHLQVAVGSEKNYLLPLQVCNTYPKDHYYLQNNEGKLDLTTHHQFFDDLQEVVDWENDNLTLVQDYLLMSYLRETDVDHPIFDHLLIDCYGVVFWFQSVVNPTILHKFAKHCNTKSLTSFTAEEGVSSDITVPLIFNIFENIKKIRLKAPEYAYNRWIEDVLKLKNLSLTELGIGGRFEKLFSFVADELSQLFQAQDPEFFLVFYCSDPPVDAVRIIRQKLGTHFKEFTYEKGHIDGVFVIKLGLEMSGVTWMWFQINPETLRNNDCGVYHLPI